MVNFCCVPQCSSRSNRESFLSFYRFPKNKQREKIWKMKIGRGPYFQPTQNTRVCSKHFKSGKRSMDPNSVDYVPSIFLFSQVGSITKSTACEICPKRRCICNGEPGDGSQCNVNAAEIHPLDKGMDVPVGDVDVTGCMKIEWIHTDIKFDLDALEPQVDPEEDINDERNGDAHSVDLKPDTCLSHTLRNPKSKSEQELIKVYQSPPPPSNGSEKPELTFAELDMLKVHACSVCQKLVIGKLMSRHRKLEHPRVLPFQFQCFHCPVQSISASSLSRHRVKWHYDRGFEMYKCLLCDVTYEPVSVYNQHMQENHSVRRSVFDCRHCNGSFATIERWMDHVRSLHPDASEEPTRCNRGMTEKKGLACYKENPYKAQLDTKTRKSNGANTAGEEEGVRDEYSEDDSNTETDPLSIVLESQHSAVHNNFQVQPRMEYESFSVDGILAEQEEELLELFKCKFCGFNSFSEFQINIHQRTHGTHGY